jgi:hypothetical protein
MRSFGVMALAGLASGEHGITSCKRSLASATNLKRLACYPFSTVWINYRVYCRLAGSWLQ